MGVFSSVLFALCCVLFFGVVLSHADTTSQNNTVSIICQNANNPSLCWQLLKPVRNLDAVGVTNYTLNLTHTSTIECLHHAQRLEAEETTNPDLKNRYSDCSKHINSSLPDIETAQYCMGYHTYIVADVCIMGASVNIGVCLDKLNQPPLEPSTLLKDIKNLHDIFDITSRLVHLLAGNDFWII